MPTCYFSTDAAWAGECGWTTVYRHVGHAPTLAETATKVASSGAGGHFGGVTDPTDQRISRPPETAVYLVQDLSLDERAIAFTAGTDE